MTYSKPEVATWARVRRIGKRWRLRAWTESEERELYLYLI